MSEPSQARAYMQFEWFVVAVREGGANIDREKLLSSREMKGTWCVVLGSPKDYSATEVAHHSRLEETPSIWFILNKTQSLLR